MPVTRLDDNARIEARRGDVVVCVRSDGASEDRLDACLASVEAHTPGDVAVIVADAPQIFELTAPADVVLLSADAVVADSWLDGLRDAAYCDSRVATASAIASGELPEGMSVSDAAARVRSRSLRLRPRLARQHGPCTYVRRAAVELAGDPLEAAFAQRCLEAGLCHVLADDVLVGAPVASPTAGDAAGPARSLRRARRALAGLSVIVDARILSQPMTGTQLHVIEVIAALARTGNVRLSAIVTDRIDEAAARSLESVPQLELVRYADAPQMARADVVHRPFQLDNPGDLSFLTALADRVVITQQDLIGYQNPSYFASRDAWEGYRELTRTGSQSPIECCSSRSTRDVKRSTRNSSRPNVPAWSRSASTTGSRPRPSHPRHVGARSRHRSDAVPGQRLPSQEPAVRAADARRADHQASAGRAGWCWPAPTYRTARRRRRSGGC